MKVKLKNFKNYLDSEIDDIDKKINDKESVLSQTVGPFRIKLELQIINLKRERKTISNVRKRFLNSFKNDIPVEIEEQKRA